MLHIISIELSASVGHPFHDASNCPVYILCCAGQGGGGGGSFSVFLISSVHFPLLIRFDTFSTCS